MTVFFQGHDHVFCRQQLDGVVYQTLPLPADPTSTLYYREAYRSGEALPGPGRVRVKVAADRAVVEYVRTPVTKDAASGRPAGDVAFSYTVTPRRPAPAESR